MGKSAYEAFFHDREVGQWWGGRRLPRGCDLAGLLRGREIILLHGNVKILFIQECWESAWGGESFVGFELFKGEGGTMWRKLPVSSHFTKCGKDVLTSNRQKSRKNGCRSFSFPEFGSQHVCGRWFPRNHSHSVICR